MTAPRSPGPAGAAPIVVALKCVDLRPDIDSLTGAVTTDERTMGLSDADEAALETALCLAERWGTEVVAVTACDPSMAEVAEAVLRRSLAVGAVRAVRVGLGDTAPSEVVARALVPVIRAAGAGLVVCGAFSLDRGSGSVPAYLAHHLGASQALGLVAVDLAGAAVPAGTVGSLDVVRRLDAGRRERLRVDVPAVLSVEGSVARLRRASLTASLRAEAATIDVHGPADQSTPGAASVVPIRRPYRPRARALDAPRGSTLQRILELTDAATPRTPPRVVELEPAAAATEILEQLRAWGELAEPPAPDAAPS